MEIFQTGSLWRLQCSKYISHDLWYSWKGDVHLSRNSWISMSLGHFLLRVVCVLVLYHPALFSAPRKAQKGSLSTGMLPWTYVQLHAEEIVLLWPHIETARKLSPGRACRNVLEENKKNRTFCKKLDRMVPNCLVGDSAQQPCPLFSLLFPVLMYSTSTYHSSTTTEFFFIVTKGINLRNPRRKLQQALEVSGYSGQKRRNHNYQILG